MLPARFRAIRQSRPSLGSLSGILASFSNEFPTCHVQERRPRSTPPSRRSPCDLPSKSVARRPLDIVRPSSSSPWNPRKQYPLSLDLFIFPFLARRETRVFPHEAQTEHSSSYPRGKTSVRMNSQRDGGGAWTESHRGRKHRSIEQNHHLEDFIYSSCFSLFTSSFTSFRFEHRQMSRLFNPCG